jgi:hypothetical protein
MGDSGAQGFFDAFHRMRLGDGHDGCVVPAQCRQFVRDLFPDLLDPIPD